MSTLVLTILCQAAFGFRLQDKSEEIRQSMFQNFTDITNETINRMNDPTDWWHELFPYRGRKALESIAKVNKLLTDIIEERKAQPLSLNEIEDLLYILINAEGADESDLNNKFKLSKSQIRDHAMTFFSAGHYTTASLLTWTIYELRQHPDVMVSLQEARYLIY
jgi:cytochrome P450